MVVEIDWDGFSERMAERTARLRELNREGEENWRLKRKAIEDARSPEESAAMYTPIEQAELIVRLAPPSGD